MTRLLFGLETRLLLSAPYLRLLLLQPFELDDLALSQDCYSCSHSRSASARSCASASTCLRMASSSQSLLVFGWHDAAPPLPPVDALPRCLPARFGSAAALISAFVPETHSVWASSRDSSSARRSCSSACAMLSSCSSLVFLRPQDSMSFAPAFPVFLIPLALVLCALPNQRGRFLPPCESRHFGFGKFARLLSDLRRPPSRPGTALLLRLAVALVARERRASARARAIRLFAHLASFRPVTRR